MNETNTDKRLRPSDAGKPEHRRQQPRSVNNPQETSYVIFSLNKQKYMGPSLRVVTLPSGANRLRWNWVDLANLAFHMTRENVLSKVKIMRRQHPGDTFKVERRVIVTQQTRY